MEQVIANAELDKERAVFGVQLVAEQVKVVHVGEVMGRPGGVIRDRQGGAFDEEELGSCAAGGQHATYRCPQHARAAMSAYFSAADESDNARGTSRPTRQEILVQIIQPPRVEQRPEKTYLGIRVVTPFRGMLRVRDELLAELYMWLAGHDIEPTGPFFLRLHVIDMEGPMDLEVGVITTTELEGDDRVRPGVLPAGGYATLTYVDHARRANKALIEWARDNGVAFDRWDEPSGDAFACRYEAYITDPRTEPRKTKWEVELNMRVA